MIDAIRAFLDLIKNKPALQPMVAFLSLYLTTIVGGYQYIQWSYGLALPLPLYLNSFVFWQITLLFVGAALLLLLVRVAWYLLRPRTEADPTPSQELRSIAARHRRQFLVKLSIVALVAAVIIPLFARFTPRAAANIRIKLLRTVDPKRDFDPEALAYIVFELNKRQRNWYFELDLDPIKPDALLDNDCDADRHPSFCRLSVYAQKAPMIGITIDELGGGHLFWQHRENISAITTFDMDMIEPLNTYEYLAYCLLVQAAAIHLDMHCGGVEQAKLDPSHFSTGDVLLLSPPRTGLKGSILAARLSPDDEKRLLHCFGPEYLRTFQELLTLEWLREGPVAKNLQELYGVKIIERARASTSGPAPTTPRQQ